MSTPDSRRNAAAESLGLPADASPEQVAQARDQLVAFLGQAPAELSGWAERQRAIADRAVAQASGSAGAAGVAGDLDQDLSALGLEDQAPVVAPVRTAPRKRNNLLRGLGLAALSAIVVVGVYLMGDPGTSQEATQASSAEAQAPVSTPKPVDPKMVETLEKKIKEDPKDVLSMKALGQIYDGAQQYDKAAQWQERVTKVNPKDVDAWTALGVAHFNGANLDEAEKAWNQAAKLDPKKAVIHYNLGFLHMSRNDMDKARASWQKVVDLEPDSDLAKTVQSHLGKKSTPAASAPSAAASAAPSSPASAAPSSPASAAASSPASALPSNSATPPQ